MHWHVLFITSLINQVAINIYTWGMVLRFHPATTIVDIILLHEPHQNIGIMSEYLHLLQFKDDLTSIAQPHMSPSHRPEHWCSHANQQYQAEASNQEVGYLHQCTASGLFEAHSTCNIFQTNTRTHVHTCSKQIQTCHQGGPWCRGASYGFLLTWRWTSTTQCSKTSTVHLCMHCTHTIYVLFKPCAKQPITWVATMEVATPLYSQAISNSTDKATKATKVVGLTPVLLIEPLPQFWFWKSIYYIVTN